jgi:hypothetical protein
MFNEYSDDTSPPGIGSEEATALWRDRLYRCLASQPTPVVVSATGVRSAASIWAGAREWTRRFREASLGRGARVTCAHADQMVVLQLLIACLWDAIDLSLLPTGDGIDLEAHDGTADAYVGERPGSAAHTLWHVPREGGWPDPDMPLLAASAHERRDVRTMSAAPVVHCSDGHTVTHGGLLEASDAVGRTWEMRAGRVLALGGWHTRSGLTAGLLAPLLHADELFVASDAPSVLGLLEAEPITHVVDTDGTSPHHVVPWTQSHPEQAHRLRVCVISM